MVKSKYYAIKVGNGVKDKIVRSWDECKMLVEHYPSTYKSFKTEEEALEYLGIIKDVERKLEKNKKYNKNRKSKTVSVANIFKGIRIDRELVEGFENKCSSIGISKEKILNELISEWIY